MADSHAEKAFIFDGFILFFTFVGAVWTSISCSGWVKKKLRPPEDTQKFGGREALMLEELYEDIREMRRDMNELYKWHDKDDSNGLKMWYVPRAWGSKLDELQQGLTSLRSYMEGLSGSVSNKT